MEQKRDFLKKAAEGGMYQRIDDYQPEMRKELSELVAIPSLPTYMTDDGMPLGPEVIRALHYALDLAQRLGFQTHNEDDKYGWAEVGDHGPLICIFTHLDIVPVGDNWTREPFVVSEEDGWLYGRGILDNKGPAIASLYAVKACCDLGLDWPCRVRVYLGTNEENGMNDAQLYVRKYGAPDFSFVPDSQFPLSYSELGTVNFLISKHYVPAKVNEGQPLRLVGFRTKDHANGITDLAHCMLQAESEQLAQQVCDQAAAFAAERKMDLSASRQGCEITVESRGKVAYHWNEPWTAVNALAQLVLFLDTVSVGKEPDQLIHFVAQKVGMETDGASLDLAVTTETASLSLALESVKLDDFGLSFHFFLIHPAEVRVETLLNTMLRQLRKDEMELVVESMGPSFLLDKEMPLLKALYASFSELTGSTEPIKVCGGTYAKFIPNAVPFGAIFNDMKDICHTPNERIEVSDLAIWTKIYANAILRICDTLIP